MSVRHLISPDLLSKWALRGVPDQNKRVALLLILLGFRNQSNTAFYDQVKGKAFWKQTITTICENLEKHAHMWST